MKYQIITDKDGNRKSVVMSIKDYNGIVDELDDLYDQVLALQALAEKDNDAVPFEEVQKKLSAL